MAIINTILSAYANKPVWLFVTVLTLCIFATFIILMVTKNGFITKRFKILPKNLKNRNKDKKEIPEYISKEKHLLFMKDLHDLSKKINEKRMDTLKKQINIAMNITFRLNSFQFDFIKELIEEKYKKEKKNIKSALKTMAYWYAKDIINQLNFEHLKAILSLTVNNGLDQMTVDNFYKYIDNKLIDADSTIKDKLKNEVYNTDIEFFDEELIDRIISSDTYKKVLDEIKSTIINIRNKALERKEEIEGLYKLIEKLLDFDLDNNRD